MKCQCLYNDAEGMEGEITNAMNKNASHFLDEVFVISVPKMFLTLSDNNLCGALALNSFYEQTRDMEIPLLYKSVNDIIRDIGGNFTDKEVCISVNALGKKGYHQEYKIGSDTSADCLYAFLVHRDIIEKAIQTGYNQTFVPTSPPTPPWNPPPEVGIAQSTRPVKSVTFQPVQHIERKKKPRSKKEEKVVAYHLKRAEALALPATLTLEQWLATLEHFNWKCAYCEHGSYQVFEHYIPLFHGGGTTSNNCVPSCYSCNSLKLDLHPSVFEAKMGAGIREVQQYLKSCGSEVAA